MTLLRTLACTVVLLFSATESLAGEAWRVVQTAGVVKMGGTGFMPVAVQPDQALPADAWVETSTQGRVVLVRGLETIALGPNSRVQLPSQEVNGNTQVLQTLGSALYRVGKQKAPHFQVDTPYLAAVVKGTTFTVTVTDAISSVEVTEGLVEVTTPDGSDSEFVRPGFSGVVSKHDTGNVVVVNSPEAPAPEVPADSGDEPGKQETDVKSDTTDGAVKDETTIIVATIGEVDLDVKEVSGGLATSVDVPAIVEANGDGTVVEATKEEEDAAKDEKDGGGSSGPAPRVEPATEPALSVEPGTSVIAEPSGNVGPSGGGGSSGGSGPSGGDVDLGGTSGGAAGGGLGTGSGQGTGNGGGAGSGSAGGGPGSGGGQGNGNGGGGLAAAGSAP
jgi:hypothetical protein